MAAVSIPPSPQFPHTMTNRRVPLANNPNAANSPLRAVATAATKRARSHASDLRDLSYGQPPPAKRQMVEVDDAEARRGLNLRKAALNPPNAFQRKLEAARDTKKTVDRSQKATAENLETIRQWQRHYRKVFPTFVFYFEHTPEDVRVKVSRQVQMLGACEEKFFSKSVTHVVTTRQIPAENEITTATETQQAPISTKQHETNVPIRTINPSLLERSTDAAQQQTLQPKARFALEPPMQRKTQVLADVDLRRHQNSNADILHKAREMGMKIWTLEKVQRMMNTMFNTETGEQPRHLHNTRSHAVVAIPTKGGRDADLSQLLQNEKMHGPSDRDLAVATKEMVQFRGFYVYIHDMDEQTRPVMVREYAQTSKEDGKWPQFKYSAPGRCPFVDDPAALKRYQQQQELQKERFAQRERGQTAPPRTRAAAAAAAMEASQQHVPVNVSGKRVLAENNNVARRPQTAESLGICISKPLDPPKIIPAKRTNPDSIPNLFDSSQATRRPIPRFAMGEPVASGVQPSNITSAIKSQMISSTAAAPGAKAGTSKEVHQLKRKVLEKNSVPSNNSIPSSYMNDLRNAINNEHVVAPRVARRKGQDNLAHIREEVSPEEDEENARRRALLLKKKKAAEKESKPGYCENCREKFNDFDEHVVSRKHRKFALTPQNWAELDELLCQLDRPLKEVR